MRHDQWSKMGEEHLGEMNIRWCDKIGGRDGPMMLMKAIMNDYWADVPGGTNKHGWTAEHVDMVMSKLYYCWVRWLDQEHPEGDDDE